MHNYLVNTTNEQFLTFMMMLCMFFFDTSINYYSLRKTILYKLETYIIYLETESETID